MSRKSFLASLQLLVAQRGSFLTPGPDFETLQVIGQVFDRDVPGYLTQF